MDGFVENWDREFGTIFLPEPLLPENNRKNNRSVQGYDPLSDSAQIGPDPPWDPRQPELIMWEERDMYVPQHRRLLDTPFLSV